MLIYVMFVLVMLKIKFFEARIEAEKNTSHMRIQSITLVSQICYTKKDRSKKRDKDGTPTPLQY